MSERDWALAAAKQDASYLISPKARHRAMHILKHDKSNKAYAARVILHDGGRQQGGDGPNGLPYMSASMDVWREAAEALGVFDDGQYSGSLP